MNSRPRGYAVAIVLTMLVASPLFGAFSADSFPISTYPMFASVRSTETRLTHVLLVDDNEDTWPPPPSAIASDQVLQAQETLRQALRFGATETQALCERIAERVEGTGAARVEIVTSTYDALVYFEGDREPVSRDIHATCETRP